MKFLGHIVSPEGVKFDPDRIKAVVSFPPPPGKKELMSFLGMVCQLGKCSSKLSELTTPLRDLTKQGVDWVWGSAQVMAFAAVKAEVARAPCLARYDVAKDTILEMDASRSGLGAAMYQIQADGSKRLVCAAAKALTSAETRYAVIELECLCVKWACDRFREYILGKEIPIRTDHKPLVPLLNSCPLDKLPLRIQRFRLALL